jgi:hypothetical protein
MDWFRWHHGSVTDPKFQVVAKRSGASVAEVLGVWACLLEAASANEDQRGSVGNVDFEAIDCLLGLSDGRAFAIFQAMAARNLVSIDSGQLAAWERRQPKREREDNSTERSRAFRERQRAAQQYNATETDATPCNASATSETPRLEESREEKKEQEQSLSKPSASDRAERLAQVTEDAIETFNAAPFVKSQGGNVPNVSQVGREKRKQQVNRCSQTARDIVRILGLPGVTRDFWEAYWQTVDADPFCSGRQAGTGAHANWVPDFEYLTRPATMAKLFDKAAS